MLNGWIGIIKEKNFTSNFYINFLKKILKKNKLGHAGTLDPFAEGVLPIAIGEATKSVSFFQTSTKIYYFEMTWGEETDTLDCDGVVVQKKKFFPKRIDLINVLKKFSGYILQLPPKFSANKINGVRAYILARKNIDFSLTQKKVFIKKIRLINHENNKSYFLVKCGSGTYIRSLARDIANELGGVVYVNKLLRRKTGCFSIKNSISLSIINKDPKLTTISKYLLDISDVLIHIPSVNLDKEKVSLIRKGLKINLIDNFGNQSLDRIFTRISKKPVALGYLKEGFFYPKRVFNEYDKKNFK